VVVDDVVGRPRLSVGPAWTHLDLVFTTDKGQPLNHTVVYNRFKRILKAAGLPPQRFHDLRHCCATLLLVQGVHPRLVMETLGHSEVGVTMNTYSHVLTELRREPATRMNAILSPPETRISTVAESGSRVEG